jgi:hypothetical protein
MGILWQKGGPQASKVILLDKLFYPHPSQLMRRRYQSLLKWNEEPLVTSDPL